MKMNRPPIGLRSQTAPCEGGYVTAETALALPSLLMVFAVLLLMVHAAGSQLRCADAAWEAARLAARGVPPELAEAQVKRWAPAGAAVSVAPDQDAIRATVSVRIGLGGSRLPTLGLSGTASVSCETGQTCSAGDP
jgi:Flp pilus assembly protein TadG